MEEFELNTPLLFLVFNRLDTTKKVFEEIRKAKPKQLFIAADGPRTKQEKKKTDVVRKYILDNIDWNCSVKKLFRKENLGCKKSTMGALNWFFENVEKGILLEDDILPDQSFFRFCEELLEKYKDDERVMSISGYNGIGSMDIKESYFFARNFSSWGSAFWRRSWKELDLELEEYKKIKRQGRLKEYFPYYLERLLFERRIKLMSEKKIDSWSYLFAITHNLRKSFRIVPQKNLVKNIGFQSESTHTKENKWDKKFIIHETREVKFPLIPPKKVELNKEYFKKYRNLQLKRIILKKLFS
ncbi:MAG: nucleotide-diphospho-sugar transferase [Nanoarchaeota archaeon]